jgi:hypothetical protein
MEYIVAWILTSGLCLKALDDSVLCSTQNHSFHRSSRLCKEAMNKQNTFWKERKINAEMFCVKASVPLKINDK